MEDGPMLGLGPGELVGIFVVILLLFGAKKVPEIMRGFGEGLREFKKASQDAVQEITRAVDEKPEDKSSGPKPV
jgi:sec-independent protein translocase protein TatA